MSGLDEKDFQIAALRVALQDMLVIHEELMKGVRHIAIQDYRLLNDAPINARKILEETKPCPTSS